ncbi:MAG: hypothetical protein EA377_12610 [Phycisphaerales bacterium]|nr:MAG: hypothetical protein EA377_12610 [Phycisphaerales bacterium]
MYIRYLFGSMAAVALVVGVISTASAGDRAVVDELVQPVAAPVEAAEGRAIVQFRPGIRPAERPDGRAQVERIAVIPPNENDDQPIAPNLNQIPIHQIDAELDQLNAQLDAWGVDIVRPLFDPAPLNEELAREIGLDRYFVLEMAPALGVPEVVRELRRFDAVVESAERDHLGELASDPPNDVHFDLQYGLHNVGQSVSGNAGVPGADVSALAAWEITTGSPDIIVAVLDAGVNEHDDLVGQLVEGWNAVNPGGPTSDFCQSHGTRVAGVVAAKKNNEIGIAGIAPNAKVMPIVVFAGCNGTETNTANGVIHAADQGAHVLNMSLQFNFAGNVMRDAIIYARESGAVVIAASGNFGSSVAFPGRWPETLTVAATTNADTPWSGSNAGPEVTISAPGRDIWSPIGTSSYSFQSGTSFSSPLVSGVAALMLTVDPSLTHDEIQDILIMTAEDVHLPGFDPQTGHGRIDAHAALLEVESRLPSDPSADLNGDGVVNVLDLLLLLNDWGPCPSGGAECPADLNQDGEVNVLDLLLLLNEWG